MTRIIRTSPHDPYFINLVAQLDRELWERYPATQNQYEGYNKLDPGVKVIVAFENEEAVGCGAFRELPFGEVEIKRMFVHPAHRGKGISKLILQDLEIWAKEINYTKAKLETGNNQPEAVSLYKHAGYTLIPNYGPYQNMAESICMQKYLNPI